MISRLNLIFLVVGACPYSYQFRMPGGSSKVTRAASKLDSDNEVSIQSLDDKLNSILNLLHKNSSDIQEIKNEQRELRSSIEFCHASVNDLKKISDDQNEKIKNCNSNIEQILESNNKVNNEISHIRKELHAVEQYSHRNNLIIYGIPEEASENIHTVVRRLAVALQFPEWSSRLLDAAHRMGRSGEHGPRPIIIKFLSRFDKEEFLKKRRVRRNLKAMDLGFASDNPIYVNESLTASTRDLLKLTRQTAKEKNYEQVWTSNCTIFVRKAKGNNAPAIKILSSEDLVKL